MNEDINSTEPETEIPNDYGYVQLDCHIRIYDPETGEEFINERG